MTTSQQTDQIEDEAQLGFPLLGYTVLANVRGVEANHAALLQLLTPLGHASFLPALPEARTSLRRAIRAWLKELASSGAAFGSESDDDEKKTKQLVREINSPKSGMLTLALVEENIDLEELGLSYLTNLRVFYHKQTDTLSLTTTATGRQALMTDQTATPTDRALLASLAPHFTYYRETHVAGDLGRMVSDIIAAMQSTRMKSNGGVYFVPYAKRPELQALKHLIEDTLPAAPNQTNESSLAALPIIDKPKTKAQMSAIAHRSFMAELTTLQKDLERFIEQAQSKTRKGKPGRIKQESMLARLADYQGMKAKVQMYSEVLGMRQQEIIGHLDQLQATARGLLEAAAEALSEEEEEERGEAESAVEGTDDTQAPGGAGEAEEATT